MTVGCHLLLRLIPTSALAAAALVPVALPEPASADSEPGSFARGPFACLADRDIHRDAVAFALCRAGVHEPFRLLASDSASSSATDAASPLPCVPVPGGVPLFVTSVRDDKCEQWVGVYDNPAGWGTVLYVGADIPTDMALSPDGDSVYVTGTSQDISAAQGEPGFPGLGIATVAFTSDGELQWSARHDRPQGGSDVGLAIAADPKGDHVFVTGFEDQNSPDMVTIAYDASDGGVLWTAKSAGAGDGVDLGTDVVVSPDGRHVYVAGTVTRGEGSSSSLDLIVVAYDAETGEEAWQFVHDSPHGGLDQGLGLAVAPDGSAVYAAGVTPGTADDADYLTLAVSARDTEAAAQPEVAGELLWLRHYDGGYYCGFNVGTGRVQRCDDVPTGIHLSPDGSQVYVTGISGESSDSLSHLQGSTYGGNHEWATLAYTADRGELAWSGREHGRARGFNVATDIAPSHDGQLVYVTGIQTGEGSPYDLDYATLAYDTSDGRKALTFGATYHYSGVARNMEGATSIAVTPDDGTVLVTGYSGYEPPRGMPDGAIGRLGPVNLSHSSASVVATQAHQADDDFSWRWVARYGTAGEASQDLGLKVAVTPDGQRAYVLAAFRYPISEHYLQSQAEETNFYDYGLLSYDLTGS